MTAAAATRVASPLAAAGAADPCRAAVALVSAPRRCRRGADAPAREAMLRSTPRHHARAAASACCVLLVSASALSNNVGGGGGAANGGGGRGGGGGGGDDDGFNQAEGDQQGDSGALASALTWLILCAHRFCGGAAHAASGLSAAAATFSTGGMLTHDSDDPRASRSVWAPVADALAKMLAPIFFAVFGVYFIKSSLHQGLAAALKSSDVFTTAFLAFVGWAFYKYLESLNKRFDAIDATLRDLGRTRSRGRLG